MLKGLSKNRHLEYSTHQDIRIELTKDGHIRWILFFFFLVSENKPRHRPQRGLVVVCQKPSSSGWKISNDKLMGFVPTYPHVITHIITRCNNACQRRLLRTVCCCRIIRVTEAAGWFPCERHPLRMLIRWSKRNTGSAAERCLSL